MSRQATSSKRCSSATRRTIADVEPDLPDPLSEIAEDVHYTMALITASLSTAQEAADALFEAFQQS